MASRSSKEFVEANPIKKALDQEECKRRERFIRARKKDLELGVFIGYYL